MIVGFTRVSPEVFYSDGGFRAVGPAEVTFLKEAALASPKRRARLCMHESADASQQEMLIVMHRSSYVRPHRHFGKVETLGVVEGRCDALLFTEEGALSEVVAMTSPAEGGAFFYRMPPRRFHTLMFHTDWVVFLETTIGPFDPATSEGAPWAPAETDPEAGQTYLWRSLVGSSETPVVART